MVVMEFNNTYMGILSGIGVGEEKGGGLSTEDRLIHTTDIVKTKCSLKVNFAQRVLKLKRGRKISFGPKSYRAKFAEI